MCHTNGTATLEDDLAVSYRLNIPLSYDPAITLCGVYLKEVIYKNLKRMFIAVFPKPAKTYFFLKLFF